MRLAIITPTFPPYSGGIGKVAAANAQELVNLGYEVAVFTPDYGQPAQELPRAKIERLKPFLKYGNAALLPGLSRQLKGFDIIHLHYPFFGAAEIIWLFHSQLKTQDSKLIIHYHMDVVGKGLWRLIFGLHRFLILPQIIKMADKVIVTSVDYAQNSFLAKAMSQDRSRFIAVANGVDVNFFSPAAQDISLMKSQGIDPAAKIVLFVGGLDKAHYFKGVEYLIEAMSRLTQATSGWNLVIVGEGELKSRYQALAARLKIESRAKFVGYVAEKDLPKYYNLADVVVLPSIDKSEAFGLVLVEAMACAKPVIASNLPGVRSVVAEKVDGLLVEPRNIDELANKINYLLLNPELGVKYGKAGRVKVEAQYSWQIIGMQLDQLYQSLK